MDSTKTSRDAISGIRQLFASGWARIRTKPAVKTPDCLKEDGFLRLRRELLDVQRKSLVDLFKRGAICSGVYSRLLHELDVEETHFAKGARN